MLEDSSEDLNNLCDVNRLKVVWSSVVDQVKHCAGAAGYFGAG